MPQTTLSLQELQRLCKNNFYFLCDSILYRGFNLWDEIHTDIARLLHRPSRRKLIIVPRDHLKTAFVTKAWSIRTILNDVNTRILIANQVWEKAREMLFEIKELLTDKSDLSKIFGDFKSDKWNEDSIVIKQRTRAMSSPTIATTGVEAEMTSAHFNVLMLDDLQGLVNSKSKEQRDKVYRFYKNCLDLLEPDGTVIIPGTRWHQDDLYSRILEEEGQYYDVMIRSVVENGKILFPKKFNLKFDPAAKIWIPSQEPTMDYIDYLRRSRGADFYSQYMNNPVDNENAEFKREWIKYFDPTTPNPYRLVLTVDPAKSLSRNADYSGFVMSGMFDKHRIRVVDRVRKRCIPSEVVNTIFELVTKWQNRGHFVTVVIEGFGYQETLKPEVERRQRETGRIFPVRLFKKKTGPNGENEDVKKARIRALQPFCEQGLYELREDMNDFVDELLEFPFGKHDDLIDAASMALSELNPSMGYLEPEKAAIEFDGTFKTATFGWWLKQLPDKEMTIYDKFIRSGMN